MFCEISYGFFQKKTLIVCFLFFCVFFFQLKLASAQELNTSAKAQVNSWSTLNFSNPLEYQIGARFIPEIGLEKSFPGIKIDGQFSFHTTGSLDYRKWKNTGSYEKFSPYRIWARISRPQWEVRLGLQKINFGSATMLRPLMWFDRIDPRDPLQLTDGVYALLVRYYFKNNANIWIWGLAGNNKTKGWELIPSTVHHPEFGGRFQFPVPKGETAVSFHSRTANLAAFYKDTLSLDSETFCQNRYAVDGKWDIGIGLWFEASIEENKNAGDFGPMRYKHAFNLGLDYTFSIGNGLNTITEFLFFNQTDELFGNGQKAKISVFSANYPVSLFDRISAIIYYSWEDNSWYRFVSFQRTYDFWSFYLMGFWNPEQLGLYNFNEEQKLFSDKGIQIMAVYNF